MTTAQTTREDDLLAKLTAANSNRLKLALHNERLLAERDRLRAALESSREMIAELLNTCDNDQADAADELLQVISAALAQSDKGE